MKRTHTSLLCAFTLVLGLGACSDGPSSPASSATAVEPSGAQDGQVATVGTAVAVAPAVLVRNSRGEPQVGVRVQFRVTQGGGSVANPAATTDAEGFATSGTWTMGTLTGVNEVSAEVAGLAPVRFTAMGVSGGTTTVPTDVNSAFHITIRYVGTVLPRQQQAVEHAVARWRRVIVGDLPSVQANVAENACFPGQPALNEVVDDILVFVEFKEIDGPGRILGEAGPCFVRTGSGLPVIGSLRLDAADLANMERAGTLDDVVMHELGHVLGFGTLWTRAGVLTGAGTDDPHFSGAHAVAEYRAMGGVLAGVPVENTGSTGTRDGHWRESVFGNELMTGYISGVPNPLSAMTAASLRDLGYTATTSGAGAFTMSALLQQQSSLSAPLDLRAAERVLMPRFEIDRSGRSRELGEESRTSTR